MATKDLGVSHIGILARKMTKFEFSAIFVEFRPFLDMRSTAGRPGPVDRIPVDRAAVTLIKPPAQNSCFEITQTNLASNKIIQKMTQITQKFQTNYNAFEKVFD